MGAQASTPLILCMFLQPPTRDEQNAARGPTKPMPSAVECSSPNLGNFSGARKVMRLFLLHPLARLGFCGGILRGWRQPPLTPFCIGIRTSVVAGTARPCLTAPAMVESVRGASVCHLPTLSPLFLSSWRLRSWGVFSLRSCAEIRKPPAYPDSGSSHLPQALGAGGQASPSEGPVA